MNKKAHETTMDVLRQLWKAGIYIGFKEKVTKASVQKFIFYYIYEGMMLAIRNFSGAIQLRRGRPVTGEVGALGLLASGYLGEALGIPIFAPLEYVAVQVQTSRTREGPISIVRNTIRHSGIGGFYRGWQVYLLCAFQPMVQYTLIENARSILLKGQDRQKAVLTAGTAFWLGALTKAVAGTLTYPINIGRIIIQAGRKAHVTNGHSTAEHNGNKTPKTADTGNDNYGSETNLFRVLAKVVQNEGVGGLYKGLTSEIVEGILGAAILLMVKEKITVAVRAVVYAGKVRRAIR